MRLAELDLEEKALLQDRGGVKFTLLHTDFVYHWENILLTPKDW